MPARSCTQRFEKFMRVPELGRRPCRTGRACLGEYTSKFVKNLRKSAVTGDNERCSVATVMPSPERQRGDESLAQKSLAQRAQRCQERKGRQKRGEPRLCTSPSCLPLRSWHLCALCARLFCANDSS